MDKLRIYRYEEGYADIKGIGITEKGKLIITKQADLHPTFNSYTRVIRNPIVSRALSAPIKLFIDPSTKCPLKCPFCLSNSSSISFQELTKEEINRFTDEIIQIGVLKVKIGGGEPFIYPYFFDLIEKLGNAGIYVSTSTSAITLPHISAEKLEILRQNNVKVSISLDGDEKYHDHIRASNGLYKKVTESIPILLNNGIKVELRTTIVNTEESYKQISTLNDISKRFNIPIRIRSVKPKGRALSSDLTLVYPDKKYWAFFDELRKLSAQNPLINTEEVFCYDGTAHYSVFKQGLDCAAGTRSAYIDWNGNFSPCGFIASYFPPENLSNTNILTLWQTGKSFLSVRDFFRKENEKSNCSKCQYVNACQGGCPSVRLSARAPIDPRCPINRKIFEKERM